MNITFKQRKAFWAKVSKSDGCWIWTGALNHAGYGVFGTKRSPVLGMQWRAHRMAYVLEVGSIPEGMMVLHSCDRPRCVRPNHLRIGTHADNMRDMSRKQRRSGERNPRAKLSDADVLKIRAARGTITAAVLSKTYGVSMGMISMIWTRRSWTHI